MPGAQPSKVQIYRGLAPGDSTCKYRRMRDAVHDDDGHDDDYYDDSDYDDDRDPQRGRHRRRRPRPRGVRGVDWLRLQEAQRSPSCCRKCSTRLALMEPRRGRGQRGRAMPEASRRRVFRARAARPVPRARPPVRLRRRGRGRARAHQRRDARRRRGARAFRGVGPGPSSCRSSSRPSGCARSLRGAPPRETTPRSPGHCSSTCSSRSRTEGAPAAVARRGAPEPEVGLVARPARPGGNLHRAARRFGGQTSPSASRTTSRRRRRTSRPSKPCMWSEIVRLGGRHRVHSSVCGTPPTCGSIPTRCPCRPAGAHRRGRAALGVGAAAGGRRPGYPDVCLLAPDGSVARPVA